MRSGVRPSRAPPDGAGSFRAVLDRLLLRPGGRHGRLRRLHRRRVAPPGSRTEATPGRFTCPRRRPAPARRRRCRRLFRLGGEGLRGWDAAGVDISPVMVEHATRVVAALPSELGGLAATSAAHTTAITMWDYIEHSLDPAGDLGDGAGQLGPGGMLAIWTGDIGAIIARLSGRRWHLLTPRHHNFFFDRGPSDGCSRRSGFEVSRCSIPAPILDRSPRLQARQNPSGAGRRSGLDAERADRVGRAGVLPLNLGDIVSVVASDRGDSRREVSGASIAPAARLTTRLVPGARLMPSLSRGAWLMVVSGSPRPDGSGPGSIRAGLPTTTGRSARGRRGSSRGAPPP